jgi:hypothetical protein
MVAGHRTFFDHRRQRHRVTCCNNNLYGNGNHCRLQRNCHIYRDDRAKSGDHREQSNDLRRIGRHAYGFRGNYLYLVAIDGIVFRCRSECYRKSDSNDNLHSHRIDRRLHRNCYIDSDRNSAACDKRKFGNYLFGWIDCT